MVESDLSGEFKEKRPGVDYGGTHTVDGVLWGETVLVLKDSIPKVHMLDSKNYYYCIHAVGNGIRGVGTKNKNLVTCKNCLKHLVV